MTNQRILAGTSNTEMIGLVLTILLDLVGKLTDSATADRIIALLEQWLPIILAEARDLLPAVQGIIDTLRSGSPLTPEQSAAIDTINARSDDAFDTAADDVLKGA